ncbi:hypothetical protein [Streptomyces rapamycinicus]|uniref:Uncharacterized protein n=1 Tax=Streptomyces rapamycinicus TaxID=1226757 RepID=A0ABR6LSX7_9ACTN|nr:hypothetical protein [Streptomyces rapamycinicus]MBB4785451.1 hypothetical protein [Streptomyces rapamycinicus]UTO68343.1 hypothetical protein LJB45_27155 [Streptomyces rapamycinicus]UTP37631.1 hypothetical protein LIV37_32285 [Streptomyces rapamycinicus NRRL 5491]
MTAEAGDAGGADAGGADVRLRAALEPRGGGTVRALSSGLELRPSRRPDLRLHLRSNRPLADLRSTHDLRQGEHLDLVLSWGASTATTGSKPTRCWRTPAPHGGAGWSASTTPVPRSHWSGVPPSP